MGAKSKAFDAVRAFPDTATAHASVYETLLAALAGHLKGKEVQGKENRCLNLFAFKQLPRFNLKPPRYPCNIVDRDVPLGSLYPAEVGPVDAGFVRERFLA
jgi:hypothetical protein